MVRLTSIPEYVLVDLPQESGEQISISDGVAKLVGCSVGFRIIVSECVAKLIRQAQLSTWLLLDVPDSVPAVWWSAWLYFLLFHMVILVLYKLVQD